ncbi:unnamed protein product [Calicophoron daubneyi]|uniref:Uncharacterized protein n=1 Tax=Calicophoron daubneyi TaxID=300641 RepID=A0AAV2T8Q4_CALDB
MVMTQASSYMHDSTPLLLSDSAALWSQSPPFCAGENFMDKRDSRSSRSLEYDRERVLTMTFINGTSSWIKVKGIRDCVLELLEKRYLCKRHELNLEKFRPKIVAIIQQYEEELSSMGGDRGRMDELMDQAVLCGVLQLKQILHCHLCRAIESISDCERIRTPNTPPIDLSQMKESVNHQDHLKEIDYGPFLYSLRFRPLHTDLHHKTPRMNPSTMTKSEMCWNWILSTNNHMENTEDLSHSLSPSTCHSDLKPHSQMPAGQNCTELQRDSSRHKSDGLSPEKLSRTPQSQFNPDPKPSEPSSSPAHQSATHTDDDRSSQSREAKLLPTGVINKLDPESSECSLRPSDEAPTVLARRSNVSFGHHLPYHVSRRPSLRGQLLSRKLSPNPLVPNKPVQTHSAAELLTVSKNENTRLSDSSRGSPSCFTTTSDQPARSMVFGSKSDGEGHNQKTMQFLISCSPNMGVICPPNHNPFHKQ